MSENNGNDGGSFEDRLQAARTRQGLDPAADPVRPKGADASAMNVGMRAVVELVSAVVVAVVIGIVLDRRLHTMPLFLIVFLVLGCVAGVRNVWRTLAVPPGN